MAITLDQIDTAIQAIQDNGQSFALDGVQYSAANLGSLIQLRDQVRRTSRTDRPVGRNFSFNGMAY